MGLLLCTKRAVADPTTTNIAIPIGIIFFLELFFSVTGSTAGGLATLTTVSSSSDPTNLESTGDE